MIDQKQIQEWLQNGTINQEQAAKMISDAAQTRKEESSGKFITSIVSLGAILFGVGAILFVALNWQGIPNFLKIVLLLGSTFGSYYLGYVFAYQRQNYPKAGAALIFLGALLFGASTFLIAQIYNMNSSPESMYVLLGVWLVGILPVVYGFLSETIAALASLLFFAFIYLVFTTETRYIGNAFGYYGYPRSILDMLVVGVVSGIMLFGIGGFHYASEKLKPIARIYRLAGLQVSLLIIFLLGMKFPYMFYGYYGRVGENIPQVSSTATAWVVILGIIALLFSVANLFFGIVKTKIFFAENIAAILMLALSLLMFFSVGPGMDVLFRLLFTVAFAGILLMMLYIGYESMDMTIVNKAISWTTLFIVVKYFEWFWSLFNPYLFFMVGGVILIMGGIALEKKRKELKARFAVANLGYHG